MPGKLSGKDPRSSKSPLTGVLALAVAAVLSLSLVAESFAQRGGGGFSGRTIGGDGVRTPGNGGRVPGGDGQRYPGGSGPRGPVGPGGVIMFPPGGFGPGGSATTVVVDDNDGAQPQRRRKVKQKQKKQQQQQQQQQKRIAQRGGFNAPPPGERRFVPNELLLHVPSNLTTPAFDLIARRNRLTRLELRDFAMTNRRIARVRIDDGRPVAAVIRSLQAEAGIAGAQVNYLYTLQQGAQAANTVQYAIGKMHLTEAHALSMGIGIRVAVVDSMIDANHPDLAGAVAATYDAIDSPDKPNAHGTGIAGVIAAHGKLTGAAPAVQILAVTAFDSRKTSGSGQDLLKGLDWAGQSEADVVNMSFAGPPDPELLIMLAALRARGIVLIASAGNAGPKSPPLYPAADPNVIAVTATDADDRLFDQANRGAYIAVAAPGVAILALAPDNSYLPQTGTSFAAPHVSGIAALLLERNRKLDPAAIRRILMSTARDLGPPGRDDQFGAGLVDALGALKAAGARARDVSGSATPPAN